jgi:hypothetical protein
MSAEDKYTDSDHDHSSGDKIPQWCARIHVTMIDSGKCDDTLSHRMVETGESVRGFAFNTKHAACCNDQYNQSDAD